MEKAMEWGDRIPIGIIYREEKPTYCDKIEFLREGPPLIDRPVDIQKIKGYLNDFI
jgi:2-oxoglutarate ferredoxin oxidoreductase subunit beta